MEDLLEHGVLEGVQLFQHLRSGWWVLRPMIQKVDLYRSHLKGVEDIHRYGVCPLVGHVAAYTPSQALNGLTDVNGLAVIVEEYINSPI